MMMMMMPCCECVLCRCCMVWYGMVYVDLYSAIVANVSNALGTLVPGKQPSFQALFERSKVLLCAEVVRQRVPNCRRVYMHTYAHGNLCIIYISLQHLLINMNCSPHYVTLNTLCCFNHVCYLEVCCSVW